MRRRSSRRLRGPISDVIQQLESRVLLSITEPNNTLATAFQVNEGQNFGGMETFTDSISATDQRDFYRISMPAGRTSFTARLYNLSADLQLALISDFNGNGIIDNGEILQLSVNSGTTEEKIVRSGNSALIGAESPFYVEV